MMSTFRYRLTSALAGSSAVFLSIFCLLLYVWCSAAFLADLDADLEAIFRADFAEAGPGSASKEPSGLLPGSSGDSHVFRQFLDPDGTPVEQREVGSTPSLWLTPAQLRDVSRQGAVYSDLRYRDTLYRTLSAPVQIDSKAMIEILGISQQPMQESLEELRQVLVVSLLFGLVSVIFVSNRVAAYLTRPLERILGQLESVTSKGDPALRLTGRYQDREMVSLQNQVNAMLERLEASFISQRQFISNASHELRAPLANLTLAIDVCLRRPRQAEEYRETLQTCLGETQRLTQLSNQLLKLSKSDEGALLVHAEPTNLLSLARASLARKEVRAQDKGIDFWLDGEEVTMPLDPLKVGQVLDNLLDNAICYSPSGSAIKVAIAQNQESAEISVSDAGTGMTPEQLEHAFERFYRADPSRQRGTGGAGLGLAISRALAEAHGGSLVAQSTLGLGTTFTLRLPLSPTV